MNTAWDVKCATLTTSFQARTNRPGITGFQAAGDLHSLDQYSGQTTGDISRQVEKNVHSHSSAEKRWSAVRVASAAVTVGGLTGLAILGGPLTIAAAAVGGIGLCVAHHEKQIHQAEAVRGKDFNNRLWTQADEVVQNDSLSEQHARFRGKYGPWALVAGSNTETGTEFARQLAARGMDVVLADKDPARLAALATKLHQDYNVQVKTVPVDLEDHKCAQTIDQATQGLQIGLLVNDTGKVSSGAFLNTPLTEELSLVDRNMRTPMMLSHTFGQRMASQGQGGILTMGSPDAFGATPNQANYTASKTYAVSLNDALDMEFNSLGIDNLAVDPPKPGTRDTAESVVAHSLAQLDYGNTQSLGLAKTMATSHLVELTKVASPVLAAVDGLTTKLAHKLHPHHPSAEQNADFVKRYGPWALVTGGTSGIGAEFAEELAKKGVNVALVARHADKLDGKAQELQDKYGVQVCTIAADLSQDSCIPTLRKATQGLDIGLLVNNAGTWEMGPFLENDLNREAQVVDLNARASVALTREFGKDMADRGHGGVIFVSSGAGFGGTPYQANYAATKGYQLSLSNALAEEFKPHGVDVMSTAPGPVATEGAEMVDQSKLPVRPASANSVAVDALENLGKKTVTVPGGMYRTLLHASNATMSRDMVSWVNGRLFADTIGVDIDAAQLHHRPEVIKQAREQLAGQGPVAARMGDLLPSQAELAHTMLDLTNDRKTWKTVAGNLSPDTLASLGQTAEGRSFAQAAFENLNSGVKSQADAALLARLGQIGYEKFGSLIRPAMSSAVNTALRKQGLHQLDIVDGHGPFRFYEHSMIIDKLPPGMSAEQFIDKMTTDVNGAVADRGFDELVKYHQTEHGTGKPGVGSTFNVDLLKAASEAVVITDKTPDHFTFCTVGSGDHGHPEYGTRQFGFEPRPDGSVRFYTRAAVRNSNPLVGALSKVPEDVMYKRMMESIRTNLEAQGGHVRPLSYQASQQPS